MLEPVRYRYDPVKIALIEPWCAWGVPRLCQKPPPLRAPRARSVRFPGGDGGRGQPDGDVASANQGAIVGGPVLDAVFRLGRGMDSRFHLSSLVCPSKPFTGFVHQRRSFGNSTDHTIEIINAENHQIERH